MLSLSEQEGSYLKWVSEQISGAMSVKVQEGIVILLFIQDEPLHFPGGQKFKAEDICFQAARHCKIGPIARHLFALRQVTNHSWLSPNHVLSAELGECVALQYEFRLRFHVPDLEKLIEEDVDAFNYYFHQIRSDYLKELIPEVLESQEKVLGLAVADMLRVVKETGTSRDVVEKDYRKYLPSKVLKNWLMKYWMKSALHNNLVELDKSVGDAVYIKGKYVNQIVELSKDYIWETFEAQVDEDGQVQKVKLQVNPYHETHPGVRVQTVGKNKNWQSICSIEDLCFVCIRQDNMVEISRKNGVPKYFKLSDTADMHSFVSLLDGYYRLMERWTFNLCKDLPSPFLLNLRNWKCHGPVGREFAWRKLHDKGQNRPGCYILRESGDYDSYRLDVCMEGENRPQSMIIKVISDGYQLSDSSDVFSTLPQLLNYYSDHSHGVLRECIPPSEYDISPLLLCRKETRSQDSSDISKASFQPVCIRKSDIKWNRRSGMPGRLTSVCQGTWCKDLIEHIPVAVKTLTRSNDISKIQEFLDIASQCIFWQCETIIAMYGLILSNPLALVCEHLPLGPLDAYLHNKSSMIQEIDLVEAATYLANAVWYLEEHGMVHGNVRCRNLLVETHTENSFKVKLSDPGVPLYSDDQIHWIPLECHKNYSEVKKSKAADVWALGTTLWEIFTYGGHPLPGVPITELKPFYQSGKRLPQPQNCHPDIYKLMMECWAKDPDARKKPQTVLRDINQILYEVHNSRRVHTYATVYAQDSLSLATSTNSLSNVPTSMLTTGHRDSVVTEDTLLETDSMQSESLQNIQNGHDCIIDAEPPEMLSVNRLANVQVLEQLSHLNSSPSSVSLESMIQVQWWLIEMNQLELLETLGQGYYGEVRRALLTRWSGLEKEVVAVKQLKTASESAGHQDLLREISIMKKLQHKNIVEIKGVVEDPKTLLVMEYVPFGSMLVYIKTQKDRLKEKQLLKFALDIAEGMEYLGQKEIVHRDLAARNILVASADVVKISDFGLAQMTGHKDYYKLKTNRNLPVRWYAPETLQYWIFTFKSDVWSFGITLWEMFSYGQEPIIEDCKADDVTELLNTLESGKRLCCPGSCSVRIYTHLMKRCWESHPADRPDFTQLVSEIKDIYDNS